MGTADNALAPAATGGGALAYLSASASVPLTTLRRPLVAVAIAAPALSACSGPRAAAATGALPAPTLVAAVRADSVVAPGLVHRTFRLDRLPPDDAGAPRDAGRARPALAPADTSGPWMVHVLDADRRRCWSPLPVKGAPGAAGRATTSALLGATRMPNGATWSAGGVNADFFSFAPNGVPQGAHVEGGRVVTGPANRPVFAVDSAFGLHVLTLATRGRAIVGRDTIAIGRWNRADARDVALFDPAYGGQVDSARAAVAVTLRPAADGWAVAAVDTAPPPSPAIPEDGRLLVAGRDAPAGTRARLAALVPGRDTLAVHVALAPFHPLHAVGGQGVLLRRGALAPRIDSAGGVAFSQTRHPRTAVGFSADGRRLLLVVVDGRQPGYSAGMTLRELARTMRALGADEALNLDGGGSSALVISRVPGAAAASAHPDTLARQQPMYVANRPSDRGIERAVANALALVPHCAPAVPR